MRAWRWTITISVVDMDHEARNRRPFEMNKKMLSPDWEDEESDVGRPRSRRFGRMRTRFKGQRSGGKQLLSVNDCCLPRWIIHKS